MARDLSDVKPEWAWSAYTPSAEQPWNRALAAHLYRRAGFGASSSELDAAVKMQPRELVRVWINEPTETDAFRETMSDLAEASMAGGEGKRLASWWLYRMLDTPDQLAEKTILFWHGHFATSGAKVTEPRLMHDQNTLLRRDALGNFAAMVQGISRDPAMLIYLDSVTNRKAHPNENYAREVMELFCLGEGNYTEKDVQEASRCFTGWEIRREQFYFNKYQQDAGSKTLLGQSGKFGGEDAVRVILEQDACPRFIVRKLIRYFMFDEPAVPDSLVEPLAVQFRNDNLDVGKLVQRILTSRLFFSSHCIARKVRSPVELAVGLLRALESKTDVYKLQTDLDDLGHSVFYPPNVKGWDGGRTWVNSSTLLGRANLVRGFVESGKNRFAGDALEQLADANGAGSAAEVVAWLTGLLLAVPVPAEVSQRLVTLADQPGNRSRRIGEVIYTMSTLPEFQLS
ncbi:MAG: hypothetical protein CMJ48_13125 [Planctomycetaceae bacterium]|nr:hypothetical protein [Planctomycetaceae bacterium]